MPLQVTHGPILSLHAGGRQLLVFVRLTDRGAPRDRRALAIPFFIHLRQSGSETAHGPFLSRPKKRQTCIANVPVEPGIAAEYWLTDEGGRKLTRRFRCLPPHPDQGDVVIYQVTDSHGLNEEWPGNLLEHHQEHNSKIPTVVLCMGDLWNTLQGESGNEAALQDHYLEFWAVPSVKRLFSRIPILQMWDDWDYLGDNSCRTRTGSRGQLEIDRTLALEVRKDFMPGPHRFFPAGAPVDAGFAVTLAGNLLLVPDSRSMKEPVAVSSSGLCIDMLDGSQNAPCWGEHQLDWIKQTLHSSAACYKILFVSTQSFADNLEPPLFACEATSIGVRDSLGLFHKWERNQLLREVAAQGILQTDRRFIVLSGDDHTPLVRRRSFWHAPYRLKTEPPMVEPELDGMTIWEFKAGNGGGTTRIFDTEDHPPIWWGGCRDAYQTNPPDWGLANSRKADIGFCWVLKNEGGNQQCTVQALLLEDEEAAPCPGQLPRTAPRIFLEKDFS